MPKRPRFHWGSVSYEQMAAEQRGADQNLNQVFSKRCRVCHQVLDEKDGANTCRRCEPMYGSDRHPINNARGIHCGDIDPKNGWYYTTREASKGHVFTMPKYQNAIAIDNEILDQLDKWGVTKIEVTVLNFETMSFKLITNTRKIREYGIPINHDKATAAGVSTYYRDQLAMPMHYWVRPGEAEPPKNLKISSFKETE